MLILDSIVFGLFILSFIVIAETIYWFSKKEYLKAKAKYLREIINEKNDHDSPDQSFYSCVFEKWGSREMDLSKAAAACKLISNRG